MCVFGSFRTLRSLLERWSGLSASPLLDSVAVRSKFPTLPTLPTFRSAFVGCSLCLSGMWVGPSGAVLSIPPKFSSDGWSEGTPIPPSSSLPLLCCAAHGASLGLCVLSGSQKVSRTRSPVVEMTGCGQAPIYVSGEWLFSTESTHHLDSLTSGAPFWGAETAH